MNLITENILLIGSLLLFVSIVVGKTTYRFGIPTLLLFWAVGMLISVFLIIVARPLSVHLSLLPFRMNLQKRTFIHGLA